MAQIVTITNPLTGQPVKVDQLSHTAQQIDDAVERAQSPNTNLIYNGIFLSGCLVDQKQGRVLKPDTTYYSDAQLTTSAGTTSAYVTAYRYATGTASGGSYASFKLVDTDDAPTYYTSSGNVVRGYKGIGYGVDGWRLSHASSVCLVTSTGLNIVSGNFRSDWMIEGASSLVGKQLTVSVLIKKNTATTSMYIAKLVSGAATSLKSISGGTTGCVSVTFTPESGFEGIRIYNTSGFDGTANIVAVKLELGGTQTLAHEGESGDWVLNELPNIGDTLLRCQRYYQIFATSALRPTNRYDFRPVMRSTPTLGTIVINGKIYYTADAYM